MSEEYLGLSGQAKLCDTDPGPNPTTAAEIFASCEHVASHRVDGSTLGCTECMTRRADAYARQQVEAFREQVNDRICDACRENLRTV